jgi:L-alanine-DL-glutamate epimerase-like enolase superfamily enzyme
MPVALYVEFLTPAPYIDKIITNPFELDAEGFLQIPTGAGLGIELDRDALKEFSVNRT